MTTDRQTMPILALDDATMIEYYRTKIVELTACLDRANAVIQEVAKHEAGTLGRIATEYLEGSRSL